VASVTRHDNVARVTRHDNEARVTRPQQSPGDINNVNEPRKRKTSYGDAKKHYRKLYGRFKTPTMCRELIEYRKKLNNFDHFSFIVHPYLNSAQEWSLSDNKFQVVPGVRSELVYVDDD
jgi:hypothetical protein